MSLIVENRLSVIALLLFAGMGLLASLVLSSTEKFEKSYREYAIAAAAADTAAYVPAAGNNPSRIELNNLLIQILGNKRISSSERLAMANRGLELVKELDRQVDAITPALEEADKQAENMNAMSGIVANLFSKGLPEKTVQLATRRHEAISDLRAYSYRAGSETRKILQHLVETKGVLTDTYVQELNNLLPAEEEEFNLRSNRYADLEGVGREMDEAFLTFVKRFSSSIVNK